jgi:hypothetical protein
MALVITNIILRMVQYDEMRTTKVRKRKREVMMDRSAEKPTAEESFLICDDGKHSSNPSVDIPVEELSENMAWVRYTHKKR